MAEQRDVTRIYNGSNLGDILKTKRFNVGHFVGKWLKSPYFYKL